MKTLSFYLDTRRALKDGTYPVRLRITENRKARYVKTDVSCMPSEFIGDVKSQRIVSSSVRNFRSVNLSLIKLLRDNSDGAETSAFDDNIFSYSQNYVLNLKPKTKLVYSVSMNRIKAFAKTDALSFSDIDYAFLADLDEHMRTVQGCKTATRSITMRCLRALFNDAINREYITHYPFRKFKIREVRREKTYLTADEMRALISLELSVPSEVRARDVFLISFCLCGANPIDLYSMAKPVRGSVSFVRTKIERFDPDPVRIKVQPELALMAKRYEGKELYFNFSTSDFDTWKRRTARYLKRVGSRIARPDISFNYARYSWASIANSLDVPDFVIDKALGHTDITLAAKRYISFEWSKVDTANRLVLDLIFQKSN